MLEAWKIGVRVSVLDSASIGLRAISGAFLKAEGDAGKLETKMKSIHKLMFGGALAVGAGVGILAVFKKPLDEARAFQTETMRFASLGFGDKVNSQAVQFAQGMKTIGTSTRENMALLSDAMAVFKNLDHAKFAAPIMAKMKFANEAMYGASAGGANERKFMDMLKVIEFRRGLNSPQEFATQADFVQKVIAGSRNRVDASQMLQGLRAGGVALSQLSNKAFYLGLEPMIQEMGGYRVGTGSLALYNNLVQSRGSISSQQELYRLGLLDKGKVQFNKLGMVKHALPGAFKGSEVLEKDGALAMLNQVLLPAFRAHGITTDSQVLQEMGRILSNSRGSTMISSLYQRRDQIARMIDSNQGAMGINATVAAAKKTLGGKEIDFHAKFSNLMLQLGTVVLPMACAALERLLPLMQRLSTWMSQHKAAVKAIVAGLVGLGGLAIVGGTISIITGSLMGLKLVGSGLVRIIGPVLLRAPVILGAIGDALLFVGRALLLNPIGLALTAVALAGIYVYKHWATIGPYVKKTWSVVMAVFHVGMDWISSTVATVAKAVMPFAKLVGHAFTWVFGKVSSSISTFIDTVTSLLTRLWNWIANSRLGKAIGWVGSEVKSGAEWVGSKAASANAAVTDWANRENAKYDAEHGASPYVAPRKSQPVQVHSTIQLDGRTVGKAVTHHLANEAAKPQSGRTTFDPTASAPPIGLNYAF